MPNSNSDLRTAVDHYVHGTNAQKAAVRAKYGQLIGDWDVSLVENFESVFDSGDSRPFLFSFNEDVTKLYSTFREIHSVRGHV